VYGIVIALLTIVNLMQTQGVPQALSRAIAGGTDPVAAWRAALRVQAVASAGGIVLLVLSAPLLASVLDDDRLLTGLLVAALAVPSYALFATIGGVLNGRRDFARQALMNAVYATARVACVLGLALAFEFVGAVAGFALAPLIAFVALASARPRGASSGEFEWWPLVRFALPSIGLALALTATMSLDLLFVKGAIADDATAGIYAAAQNAARLTYFVMIPAGVVLFPAMAEAMAAANRARQRLLVADGVEGAIAVVLVMVAVMAGARTPLLDLAFGSDFDGASTAFELLAPAVGCLGLAYTLASLLTGSGRPIPPMIVAAAALAIQAVIGYPLTVAYGMSGAAGGTLVAAVVCVAGQAFLVRRHLGALADPTRVARLVVAAGAAFAIASQASSRADVVPICLAATLAYAAAVYALRVVPRRLDRRHS
jgi:O-antigen/teichoic acid export membrane protein